MKKSLICLLFLGSFTQAAFGVEKTGSSVAAVAAGAVKVKISNYANTKGQFAISLFSTPEGFPGNAEKAVRSLTLSAKDSNGEVVFENVPYGVYALSSYHDENNNGKLDTVFLLGIPKERYGSSNNPKAKNGPPSFDESKFTLDRSEIAVNIVLK